MTIFIYGLGVLAALFVIFFLPLLPYLERLRRKWGL